MKQAAKWLTTTGVLIVFGVIACSSSSGGGGGGGGSCLDVSGSWSLGGDCQSPSSCTVTQSGCTATLACGSDTTTATVSGSSLSFKFGTSPCTGSVSNGVFTGTCSESGSTCNVSATCSSGVCGSQNASGGSGGSGSGGTSGNGGTSGGGGTGPGNCGGTLYSNDGACQSCMETACCSQLAACAPGSSCEALLLCVIDNGCLEAADFATCLQTFCPSELQSGGDAAVALANCDEANCAAQCSTTSGGGQ